ncbi:MAG TPA: NAD-dependent epimerase/dehydratase family protein [Acidiferrobacterales bacterium]
MRIAVTGSASRLARVLLPRLLDDPRVAEVVGIDVRAPRLHHPRLTPVTLDVRAPELGAVLDGIDMLAHLAFVVMQADLGRHRRDRALMRDINVGGSINVFSRAAAAGVRRIVHLSSAAVYRLDGTAPMTETQPRAALAGFHYGADKAAVEDWLDGFERDHTRIGVVRLRPHAILGPQAQPFLRALLRLPFYPALPAPAPLTQCVHEDDVAEAVLLALFGAARGAFNLACADALPFRALVGARHRLALPLPWGLARAGFALGWRWFGWGTDPGWLPGLRHPVVLDSTRARRELGWRPRHDRAADIVQNS